MDEAFNIDRHLLAERWVVRRGMSYSFSTVTQGWDKVGVNLKRSGEAGESMGKVVVLPHTAILYQQESKQGLDKLSGR